MKRKPTKSAPKKAPKAKDRMGAVRLKAFKEQLKAMRNAADGPLRSLLALPPTPKTARTRTGRWRETFLEALALACNVTLACRAAGVDRKTAYDSRGRDKEFAAQWDEALETGIELLEGEMLRRAREGVTKPIFQSGIKVGEVQEYSDTLAIFLAKAHRPDKYRERVSVKHENTPRTVLDTSAAIAEIAALVGKGTPPPAGGGSGAAGEGAGAD